MPDKDVPKRLKPYSRVEEYNQQMADLRSAIGRFLADFAMFETYSLTFALKALSQDAALVEHLPELMDLNSRLKLLKYLGVAHQLPEELHNDIAHVRSIACELLEYRNDIAHGIAALFGKFLTDTNADLTPGVQRRRSHRVPPKQFRDTPEAIEALNKEWMHDLPTIMKWSELTQQLQRSTHQLGHKLQAYKRGEPWENRVVTRMQKPSKMREDQTKEQPKRVAKKKRAE